MPARYLTDTVPGAFGLSDVPAPESNMAAWIGQEDTEKVSLTDEQMGMLCELADSGAEYWEKVQGFILQNKDRDVNELTLKQQDWYYVIKASIDREIDLREAKLAFGEDSEQYKHERKRYSDGRA